MNRNINESRDAIQNNGDREDQVKQIKTKFPQLTDEDLKYEERKEKRIYRQRINKAF